MSPSSPFGPAQAKHVSGIPFAGLYRHKLSSKGHGCVSTGAASSKQAAPGTQVAIDSPTSLRAFMQALQGKADSLRALAASFAPQAAAADAETLEKVTTVPLPANRTFVNQSVTGSKAASLTILAALWIMAASVPAETAPVCILGQRVAHLLVLIEVHGIAGSTCSQAAQGFCFHWSLPV